MYKEIPSFMLAPGRRRAPQTVSIIRPLGSSEAHFATGVRAQSHLSQTSSTTYKSIFWVNVAYCRILSHRRGPKASKFEKFAVPATRREADKCTCRISGVLWKLM
jgi:hypothetical protein